MLFFVHLLLYIFYLSAFLWFIRKWHFFELKKLSRLQLAIFFLMKVAAGILLTVIYTFYYTNLSHNDIYRYFGDSVILSKVLFQNPAAWMSIMFGVGLEQPEVFKYLENTQNFSHSNSDFITNNSLIIRLNVVINYLSLTNIWINTLFFNFLSFWGLVALYKALQSYFKILPSKLYLPIFLLPSVIFWSSGILKESIFFMAFGFWLHSFLRLMHSRLNVLDVLVLIVTSWLIISVKIYVFIALLFCAFIYMVLLAKQSVRLIYLISAMVIFSISWYNNFLSLTTWCEIIINKRIEFIDLAIVQNAGSLIQNVNLFTNCTDVFWSIPLALFDAIFRPLIWHSHNLFQLAFAIENILLLSMMLFLILKFFKKPEGRKMHLFVFFILFSILNYLFIGLTVPIEGAIVHYRIIATPFLLLSVLLLIDLEKFKRFISNTSLTGYGKK